MIFCLIFLSMIFLLRTLFPMLYVYIRTADQNVSKKFNLTSAQFAVQRSDPLHSSADIRRIYLPPAGYFSCRIHVVPAPWWITKPRSFLSGNRQTVANIENQFLLFITQLYAQVPFRLRFFCSLPPHFSRALPNKTLKSISSQEIRLGKSASQM